MKTRRKLTHICQNLNCKKKFPHRNDSRNKYCSHSCSGKCKNDYQGHIYEQKKKEARDNYNKNPKICLECKQAILYEQKENKFCDQTCSAIFNNRNKKPEDILKQRVTLMSNFHSISREDAEKLLIINDHSKKSNFSGYNIRQKFISQAILLTKIINRCESCSSVISDKNKFCNNKCQRNLQWHTIKEKIEKGEINNPRSLRRYLIEKFGYMCNCCKNYEWMGKEIPLELEHKDGDSENNNPMNLELLCSNCHAQTSTYKAKNKGHGRHARRQRYAEGKSY